MSTDLAALQKIAAAFLRAHPANHILPEKALAPGLAGTRLYDEPIIGAAAADDPLFARFGEAGVVGAHHLPPRAWLPEAASVVSLFFPRSEAVRRDNRRDFTRPSPMLMHAYIDGQAALSATMAHLAGLLSAEGYRTLVPHQDPRYQGGTVTLPGPPPQSLKFTSNWSERHVAHACGLGTFGLSAGLITARGKAGRLSSLVTAAFLAPTPRGYARYDEYCTRCGACAAHCPVRAISKAGGKRHPPCGAYLNGMLANHPPYYGCAKCQAAVPCETGLPL